VPMMRNSRLLAGAAAVQMLMPGRHDLRIEADASRYRQHDSPTPAMTLRVPAGPRRPLNNSNAVVPATRAHRQR